jgi:hypothetical protein
MDTKIDFLETLPPNCPPAQAWQPDKETYYRLAGTFPPLRLDFLPHRKLYPNIKFDNECEAMAISIFDTISACNKMRTFPTLKNKEITIKITLPLESGVIDKTRGKHHFSWWISKKFSPIEHCEQMDYA